MTTMDRALEYDKNENGKSCQQARGKKQRFQRKRPKNKSAQT